MGDTVDERLLATLRRHQPTKLRAFTSDDESRDVAIPGGRKKWSQVIAALQGRAWSYVVMLDKSGAELATFQNTGPAADLEEIPPAKTTGEHALAQRMTELALNTASKALAWRDEETKALLKAQGDVVREMTQGMKALAEVYREMSEVKAETASDIAAADAAANSGQLAQLMEALPTLLQALPVIKAMLAGPSAPEVSNGHNRRKE